MVPTSQQQRPWLVALWVALAMNLLNLFEPLTVDDVCHHYYAAQVAAAPLDPYGFDLVWHQKPAPAWDVMVAPVHSYYWAPAIRLFGDSPVAWHLWFLPVHWLFCHGLLLLLRRFARPHAAPLLAAIALGPNVLPGVNLMLEVPMLALAFASLNVLLRAFDQKSLGLAVGAGCLFGLAFQTKYSAMGFFAPWVLFGIWRARPRELLVGLAAAACTALGIEGLIALSHGSGSYFLRCLELTQRRDWHHLSRGLLLHVAVLGMPAALLALRGFGLRGITVVLVAAVYAFGYVGIAMVRDDDDRSAMEGAIDSLGYLAMAAVTWGTAAWLLLRLSWRGLRRLLRRGSWRGLPAAMRGGLFLAAWFACELVSSLVVSPFPAARRVLMITVAFTIAAGWLCARRRGTSTTVRNVAIASVLLGIGYQAIDFIEGRAWVSAATGTVDYARRLDPQAKVFFTGGWGFEFYAPRAGMAPLLRDVTTVQRGDFIAVGSIDGDELPWFEWSGKMEKVDELAFGTDGLPLSVQQNYYSGRRPLDNQATARFFVFVFRAVESFSTRELVARPNEWLGR
ncbi:MAG: hypothetical protein IT455_16785 [Planctomycetes bacterium]|nr:hypothetical protein [Planctomycetota bacterium]